MPNLLRLRVIGGAAASLVALAGMLVALFSAPALAQEPIKIGFSMSLTGPLAPNGKQALLGMQIWEEEIERQGRPARAGPVKLIYYDDQSQGGAGARHLHQAARCRQSRSVIGPYSTVPAAAAMPVVIQKNKPFVRFGLDVNAEFHYDRFFSMIPKRPQCEPSFTRGFFDAAQADPEADDGGAGNADAEFAECVRGAARMPRSGAEDRLRQDLSAVDDRLHADRARRPGGQTRHLRLCSYPLDSVGMVKAVNEIGFKPKMVGGAMVGLQATVFKNQLGPLLNGFVNYETWVPRTR